MENRYYVSKLNEIVRKCNEISGRGTYLEAKENAKVTPSEILGMEKILKELIEQKQ